MSGKIGIARGGRCEERREVDEAEDGQQRVLHEFPVGHATSASTARAGFRTRHPRVRKEQTGGQRGKHENQSRPPDRP